MNEWNFAPIPEFSAFFHIFQTLFMRISRHFIIFWEYPWNSDKIPPKFRRKMTKFIDQNRNEMKFHFIPAKKFDGFLLEFWGVSGAKAKKSCRARKILKNASFLAIVAVDTAENEPLKVWGVSFHYFNRILSDTHKGAPLLRGVGVVSERGRERWGVRPRPHLLSKSTRCRSFFAKSMPPDCGAGVFRRCLADFGKLRKARSRLYRRFR